MKFKHKIYINKKNVLINIYMYLYLFIYIDNRIKNKAKYACFLVNTVFASLLFELL